MMIVDESNRVARLTEVVTSHPGGGGYGNSVEAISAWAGDGSIQLFRRSSCKGPDVLSRVSVGDTNTRNIVAFNGGRVVVHVTFKRSCVAELVANDTSAYAAVASALGTEGR